MTIARSLLVDRTGVGLYHCVSRCVRRALLCGDGFDHRKDWVRDRLRELAGIFSIDVAAYAVMSNHLHVVVRTDPIRAAGWSDLDVARRWSQLFPRDVKVRTGTLTPEERAGAPASRGKPAPPVTEAAIEALAADTERIAVLRDRLSDLSWFMKCLKEPISRRANREDRCAGAFWEERFRSYSLLDDAAVLACLVYVDLNVVRAMLAATPEDSDYTSVQDRIRLRQLYHTLRTRGAEASSPASRRGTEGSGAQPSTPEDGWLAPIEHRDGQTCQGLLPMTLDQYLHIVDTTARMTRADKPGAMAPDLPPILERLDIDAGRWKRAMRGEGRMCGTAVGSLVRRAAEATRRGTKCVIAPLDVYAS